MTDWESIESAPKDGTSVLLWDADCLGVDLGFWSRRYDRWIEDVQKAISGDDAVEMSTGDLIGFTVYIPTHWMPLPEPPHDGRDTNAGN